MNENVCRKSGSYTRFDSQLKFKTKIALSVRSHLLSQNAGWEGGGQERTSNMRGNRDTPSQLILQKLGQA